MNRGHGPSNAQTMRLLYWPDPQAFETWMAHGPLHFVVALSDHKSPFMVANSEFKGESESTRDLMFIPLQFIGIFNIFGCCIFYVIILRPGIAFSDLLAPF